MHIFEPSTMPLSEHEEAVTQATDLERQSPDRVAVEPEPRQAIDQSLASSQSLVSRSIAAHSAGSEPPAWWHYFQQCSRLLIAVIEPMTLTLTHANDYFCQMVALETT